MNDRRNNPWKHFERIFRNIEKWDPEKELAKFAEREKRRKRRERMADSEWRHAIDSQNPRAHVRWPEKEEKDMLERIRERIQIDDIAYRHGRSRGAIKKRWEKCHNEGKLGYYFREEGQIINLTQWNKEDDNIETPREDEPWSEQEEISMLSGLISLLPINEIASRHGRSPRAIINKWEECHNERKLGYTINGRF